MNAHGHKIHIYCLSAAALTLIATALRALCFGLAFDGDIGYFAVGATLPVFLHVLEVVSLVAFFSLFFFVPKSAMPAPKKEALSPARRLLAAPVALLFLLCFIQFCRVNTGRGLPLWLFVLGVLFIPAAAVFFCLPVFGVRRQGLVVALGAMAVFGVVCLIAFSYFDGYTPMNAPHKTGQHLAAVAVLFYLLYVLRDVAGAPMPRARILSSITAFFAAFVVGVSDLLAYPMGAFSDPAYLPVDLLLIGLAVWIGADVAAHALSLLPDEKEAKK